MNALDRFSHPVFVAVLVAWIMTVVLHEFAHGLVASWGGDYTIKERGGLSLNPLQYVDPVMSLLLPAVFLVLGGVPLPGGATYVRRDLLRSRGWDTAVSLAGPAANVIVFLLCAVALHPAVGWIDWSNPTEPWTDRQTFVGALLVLQGVSVLLNLVPVPPLDGYQAVAPYLPYPWRQAVETPPTRTYIFYGYFAALWLIPAIFTSMLLAVLSTLEWLGYSKLQTYFVFKAFQNALFPG